MDIQSNGDHYPGGIPKGTAEWEDYILTQQAMFGRASQQPLSKRRQTVVGIPGFGEFIRSYEDRAHERRRRARQDSHQSAADDKEELSHDNMHFGVESLSHSYSSTISTASKRSVSHLHVSKKHHASAARHSRHSSSSRPKMPDAYMSAPDVPRPDSPETFKRKIHEHKAHFYANQKQQRNHSRPRFKSLLSSNLFDQPIPVSPPRPARQQAQQPATTVYGTWREDCDEVLQNKSTMTHVPRPPIDTCAECANNSLVSGIAVPIACNHSLDSVLRTGITSSRGTFAYSKAYFAILKSERQRWHTDRFAACDPKFKASIEADAQTLFILINNLFEVEKLRMVECASIEPEHLPAHQPHHTPDYFRFRPDDRPVW